jgi:hypothetical protein
MLKKNLMIRDPQKSEVKNYINKLIQKNASDKSLLETSCSVQYLERYVFHFTYKE